MAPGCFSWCPLLNRHNLSSSTQATGAEKSSLNFVPSTLEYTAEAGKETLQVLKSAAKFIPVPFIQEAIQVALNVLQACEDATAIEERVQVLQSRVGNLMIVIINNVTPGNGDVNEASIIQAAKKMEKDIADLKSTLESIIDNLNEIKAQSRWLLIFFKDLNKSKIDDCVDRLGTALERFNVSNDLRSSEILRDIQRRLEKIQGLTQRVAGRVEDLHNKVDDNFDRIFSNLNGSKAHTASSVPGRQQMPGKPSVFHGRDQLVQELSQLLSEERTSRVCVLGPGGMGKTSLALAVVESPFVQAKYGPRCFWVPCVEATSPAAFLQLLHVHLRISRSSDDIVDDILAELNVTNEPRLILLDNFETAWVPVEGRRHQVNNVLRRLGQIHHVALLVTMRGTEPPCDDIVWKPKILYPVDKEAARSIFHNIHPKSAEDHDIDRLLAALGYLPFAVTLMAKLGRQSHSSAKALLEEWSQVGTRMISYSSSPEDNMNRSISLSVDRDFVQQNPDALLLLSVLSLLPAGTSKTNLHWWAPNLKSISSAVATLSDTALLLTKQDESLTLFTLPVIQSFMLTTNRIPRIVRQQVQEACCQYVTDHARRYYDPSFKQHSQALAAEDTNIQSILLAPHSDVSSIPLDRVVETLLHFTWYRYDTRPSIEIAQRTLELAKTSGKGQYIAEALSVLGGTYLSVNKFDIAEKYLSEGYQYSDKVGIGHDVQGFTVECGWLLADARIFLHHPLADVISFIHSLQSKFGATSGDFYQAHLMMSLGFFLSTAGNRSEALNTLNKAIEIFKRIKDFPDVARSMLFIAMIYYHTSRLADALEKVKEASDIIENLDHLVINGRVNSIYGTILVSLERYTEAITKLEKSLLINQYVGSINGVARNLENLGYVYICREDYRDASAAYEAAMEKYAELGQDSVDGGISIQRCKKNLTWIRRKVDGETVDIIFVDRAPL